MTLITTSTINYNSFNYIVMANWTILKTAIADVVRANGNQEITGQSLQNVLNSIISALGGNATFAGIATPSTNPGTFDGPVFYLAGTPGVYANFGGVVVSNEAVVLTNTSGTWSKVYTGLALKNNTVLYVRFKGSTVPTSELGNNGDVYMFVIESSNNYRIYIKESGAWVYQSPANLSLSTIYRYENSLFVKESVENTGKFIEVAKDFATDIAHNFATSTFYNLHALNNAEQFLTKKDARLFWNTSISEKYFKNRTHGVLIYYELSDGNKLFEQFIGATASALFFEDANWATIWEQNADK